MEKKTKDFRRVLRPGAVEVWKGAGKGSAPLFLKVEYKEGRLSISGAEGPRANGDCWGSCGQCVDALAPSRLRELAPGWDRETVKRLRQTWEDWHLNDMRAGCVHQRAEKWAERGRKSVTLYHWRQMDKSRKARDEAEKAAQGALTRGETFAPTPEQVKAANSPWSRATWTPEAPEGYEAARSLYPGDKGPTESKTLGWLYPLEAANGGTIDEESTHPDGLLCRPCPECGYKYGSAWLREEVPADVLRFLQELPEADAAPAWV